MNNALYLLMGLDALPTFSVSAAVVEFAGSPKSWVVISGGLAFLAAPLAFQSAPPHSGTAPQALLAQVPYWRFCC
jgi:hypothetical protein